MVTTIVKGEAEETGETFVETHPLELLQLSKEGRGACTVVVQEEPAADWY